MASKDTEAVLKLMKDNDCDILDLKFIDVPGTWQHVALPISEVDDNLFNKGTGFDGSSVRGFQSIEASDMLLLPHAETAKVDPFEEKTVSIIADIRDPLTAENYTRDPRYVTIKAEEYLKSTGIGDTSYWGPELEFFVFDSIQFFQKENEAYFKVDSDEGIWNSGAETMIDGGPNIGQRPGYKGGYFPAAPIDTMHGIRGEMVRIMVEQLGFHVEKHHHEVATGGQGEIDLKYDTMLSMADKVMRYKYVVKNVAQSYGKVATFMPKPIYNDNGTGMHTHQSIWKDGKPLFAGNEYAGLSKMALNYIGGLIKHGQALMGLCAPTSNSYKRLVPGFEAPTILGLSARNRTAAFRVPMYDPDNKAAKRVEFRSADGTCNPYLAFPAMLMAGLDGIENEIDPGDVLDEDLFSLPDEEQAKLKQVPNSIDGALNALEDDHEFLLKGDVFTSDLLEAWISYKRETEVDQVRTRPHPWEYYLTFNA